MRCFPRPVLPSGQERYRLLRAALLFPIERLKYFSSIYIPSPFVSTGFFDFDLISMPYSPSFVLGDRKFFGQSDAFRYPCEHFGGVYGFGQRDKVMSSETRCRKEIRCRCLSGE